MAPRCLESAQSLVIYPLGAMRWLKFCKDIGFPLLPWQEQLARDCLRYKPDGRWLHPLIGIMLPRQQGKSTFMALRILFGIYVLGEKMHLATAHKLTTSSEIFFKVSEIIEGSQLLLDNFTRSTRRSRDRRRFGLRIKLDTNQSR